MQEGALELSGEKSNQLGGWRTLVRTVAASPAASGTWASLLLSSLLPLFNHSRWGDISSWYADHLHHPFATWVALQRGWEIYTQPFSQIWSGSGFPFEHHGWGEMPLVYPPGMLAVFLPLSLLGRYLPLSSHAFGVLGVEYLLVLAHLSLWAMILTLTRQPSGSRASTLMAVWIGLLSLALEGFYDPLFLGAGAMVAHRLGEDRPASALRWFSAAALLHFRAAAFAPLGLVALWQVWRRGLRGEGWPKKTLIGAGLAVGLCLFTFFLMYPATQPFRAGHPLVLGPNQVGFWAVLLASLAVAAASYYCAGSVVAGMVLTCLLLCLLERQNFWWHGGIVLAPLLTVGACQKARQASAARAILLGWGLSIYPVVWGGAHVLPLLWEVSIGFKPH